MAIVLDLEARWIWRRCRALLESCAPEIHARLPPGASPETIAQVELALGCALPATVAGIFRIHNGLGLPAFIDGSSRAVPLLGLRDALAEHRFQMEMANDHSLPARQYRESAGVQPAVWRRGWLPIALLGNGDSFFLDFEPGAGGTHGQVVERNHESDELPIRYRSLGEYLAELDVDWVADLSLGLGKR